MFRTELIPQTSAAINKGKVHYHFSVKTSSENAPTADAEHQLAFFESHFTELKYGGSSSKLTWNVGGVAKWDADLVADEWHNVAYEIDFDAGSVALWHSTGGDALKKVAGPEKASAQSDGKDFHVGVLRLPGNGDAKGSEDWFFSGVYVEDGEVTTAIGAGGAAPAESAAPVASASSAAVPVASSSAAVMSSSKVAASSAPTSSAAQATSSVVAAETPAASSVVPSSSAVEQPASSASATSAAATPSASSGASLPDEFTIKDFIAWLKEETGTN